MSNESVTSVKQESKHILLHHAVMGIDSVIEVAQILLDKIVNDTGLKEKTTGVNPTDDVKPSLAIVLTSAAEIINAKNGEIHDLLNKINDALF